MQVRIVRTVEVKPESALDFVKLSLDVAQHTREKIKVDPNTYWSPHHPGGCVLFRSFTDFDSMADYEQRFLEGLLLDETYLKMAEGGVKFIENEPRDELLVRLLPDDYFMSLKGRRRFEIPKAPKTAGPPPRYLREREYCAEKGKLREVMTHTFHFMGQFTDATGLYPEYFCTRFATERIGCSKLFVGYDECIVCGPIFMAQDHLYATDLSGLLLSPPIDTLYTRVTEELAGYQLR